MLGHKIDFSIESVYNWAEMKQLEVVYVTGNSRHDKYKKFYATIEEWLYLIDNAEYVITNSFHGCLFSVLFHKPFFSVLLTGKHLVEMNTCIKSLYELFNGLLKLNSNFDSLDDKIDWERIDEKLIELKNFCKLLKKMEEC
jgi:hypothetical protein